MYLIPQFYAKNSKLSLSSSPLVMIGHNNSSGYVCLFISAMKAVKTDLRNRMGDEWLNDSLVVYIENEIFDSIDNELILNRFQNMDSRRNQLSRSTKYSVS